MRTSVSYLRFALSKLGLRNWEGLYGYLFTVIKSIAPTESVRDTSRTRYPTKLTSKSVYELVILSRIN